MAQGMLQRTLRDFLQETEEAINSERIDAALAMCQSILASFPESLEAQRLLGEVYLAQGHLEGALRSFDWVLTNDPENVIAYCNRALVSERMSDYDTALDCYQQAYELSRGNSQIRQEFNQLSAKAGQQGFMLSRAGLARLYLRGNLLYQAVQEWEAVLTAAPDRLDARIGLLETCWREGAFERVEQLASRILQDVPGCVKALLLFAHVTASSDMAHAQALIQRAEALDPDLVMAQELFADLQASRPDDSFLKLLRKEPAVVGPAPAPTAMTTNPSSPDLAGDTSAPYSSDGINAMSSLAAISQWGNNDTPSFKPQLENVALPPATPPGAEPVNQSVSNPISISSWDIQNPLQQPAASSGEPEPWQLLQEALDDMPNPSMPPLQDEPIAWGDAQSPSVAVPSSAESSDRWEMPANIQASASPSSPAWDIPVGRAVNPSSPAWDMAAQNTTSEPLALPSWDAPTNENEIAQTSAPPDWLSMLTQNERRQMSTPMPAVNPSTLASLVRQEPQSQDAPAVSDRQPVQPPTDSAPVAFPPWEKGEDTPLFPSTDTDEELLFGPAWLKSLGATVLDDEGSASAAHPVVSAPPAQPVQPESELSAPPAVLDTWTNTKPDSLAQSLSVTFEVPSVPEAASPMAIHETPATYDPWSQESQPEVALSPALPEQTYTSEDLSLAQPVQPDPDPVQPTTFESWQSFDISLHSKEREALAPRGAFLNAYGYETQSAPSEKADNHLLSTLEALEQQLRSKGFVPLEPNSLASIAQAENQGSEMGAVEAQESQEAQNTGAPQVEVVQEKQPLSTPVRSSAFEDLDAIAQPLPDSLYASEAEAATFVEPEPEIIRTPVEPQWLRELRATPATSPAPAAPQETWPLANRAAEAEASAIFQTPPISPVAQPQLINTPPVRLGSSEAVFEPAPAAPGVRAQQGASDPSTSNVPSARSNPFMGGELETTMKRPAVRLQSIQRPTPPVRETPNGLTAKARPVEPKEPVAQKPAEAKNLPLSYKDRLLKGYQHQLVGDYDEAMQEYRLIIRSAPELLSEVVSNVRALLKIAPRYSAGYRVLGDAYMRQGEYLQAMESYNRALTMAKKEKN